MKQILATITVAVTLVASSASAFDPAHLKTLKDTGDCINCDLSGASLEDAKLMGAKLEGADLKGAKLGSAYLVNAKLKDANLGGVTYNPVVITCSKLTNTAVIRHC